MRWRRTSGKSWRGERPQGADGIALAGEGHCDGAGAIAGKPAPTGSLFQAHDTVTLACGSGLARDSARADTDAMTSEPIALSPHPACD